MINYFNLLILFLVYSISATFNYYVFLKIDFNDEEDKCFRTSGIWFPIWNTFIFLIIFFFLIIFIFKEIYKLIVSQTSLIKTLNSNEYIQQLEVFNYHLDSQHRNKLRLLKNFSLYSDFAKWTHIERVNYDFNVFHHYTFPFMLTTFYCYLLNNNRKLTQQERQILYVHRRYMLQQIFSHQCTRNTYQPLILDLTNLLYSQYKNDQTRSN